eukprot:jgi/Phyca11/125335/e_gw1.58.155.1
MKLRGLLRERDVCEVVASLKEIQPGLREVGSFLATFQVLGKAVGKPLSWTLDPNYVADNVRYRLPEPTIDRALEQLREKLCGEQAEIQIDSDGESGDSDDYVMAIETIGTYTRDQLDAMKWLWNLQAACRRGVALCTWLNNDVKEVADERPPVIIAFDEVLNTWPFKTLPGFGFDLMMSDTYCIRGSMWLNDDAIRAFTVFLQRYKNNAASASVEMLLPENTRLGICASIAVCQFVLVPVNFDGVHWGCLVIDGRSKVMHLYDSMNITKNVKRLKAITREIESELLETYQKKHAEEPAQKDSDSCGVLACLYMWKCVSSDAPGDVSTAGITKLRWTMLHEIMKIKRRL